MSSLSVWSVSVSLNLIALHLTWVLVPSHCLSPLLLPYKTPASDHPPPSLFKSLILSCSIRKESSLKPEKKPHPVVISSPAVFSCHTLTAPSPVSFFFCVCLPADFSFIHVLYPSFVGAVLPFCSVAQSEGSEISRVQPMADKAAPTRRVCQ